MQSMMNKSGGNTSNILKDILVLELKQSTGTQEVETLDT